MNDLSYTLLTDGSSDRALIPILSWLLRELTTDLAIQAEWADLRRLPRAPETLADRILKSLELYPCDLLFVHRDAEKQDRQLRIQETEAAVALAGVNLNEVPVISVVPVKMQEAWLLFDEMAIRRAAGNPNGTCLLNLPPMKKVEALADPKTILHDLLRSASGLSGRRLSAFSAGRHAIKVSSSIVDFTPLRTLSSFQMLENDVNNSVAVRKWNT